MHYEETVGGEGEAVSDGGRGEEETSQSGGNSGDGDGGGGGGGGVSGREKRMRRGAGGKMMRYEMALLLADRLPADAPPPLPRHWSPMRAPSSSPSQQQ